MSKANDIVRNYMHGHGFSKEADIGDFLEIQTKSFKNFFQLPSLPEECTREEFEKEQAKQKADQERRSELVGLSAEEIDEKEEVFETIIRSIFPIESNEFKLKFIHYSIDFPKYMPWECKEIGVTYESNVTVRVELTDQSKKEKFEQDVFLGAFPMMTQYGTFVINGAERVVVSQIQRSPGVFFDFDEREEAYIAKLVPVGGIWFQFEVDMKNNILYARIDRKRVRGTVVLKAFDDSADCGNPRLLRQFYEIEELTVGSELVGRMVADIVFDPRTGEVLIENCPSEITHAEIELLKQHEIRTVKVIREAIDEVGLNTIILKTLEKDECRDMAEAREHMFQLYTSEYDAKSYTPDQGNEMMHEKFLSYKKYDLGRVGRLRINQRFGFQNKKKRTLDYDDISSIVKHLVNLAGGKGNPDDIDHLQNRRIRPVGELLASRLADGMIRMRRNIQERLDTAERFGDNKVKVTDKADTDETQAVDDDQQLTDRTKMPQLIFNTRPLTSVIQEFFGSSQLSQFMDQTNPLADLTHKRRLSALGPGGLSRDRAGFDVRDVHTSHYGRICPIETPEGPNIGLIVSMSTYARINELGLLITPARVVENARVTDRVVYLTANEEERCRIAPATVPLDKEGRFAEGEVPVRSEGEFRKVHSSEVSHMDVSPKQIVSISTALVPFLEHDDANRALMGSNMQRQAVPLLNPHAPIITTGLEAKVAEDSGYVVLAKNSGKVVYLSSTEIHVERDVRAKTRGKVVAVTPSEKEIREYVKDHLEYLEQVARGKKKRAEKPGKKGISISHEYVLPENDLETVIYVPMDIDVATGPASGDGGDARSRVMEHYRIINRIRMEVSEGKHATGKHKWINSEPGVKEGDEVKAGERLGDSIDRYRLLKYKRSNQGTCINQRPIVEAGDAVQAGQALADGPATHEGQLALGQNIVVAVLPWEGYNFEDAVLVSERIVRNDVFTSIHIEEFEAVARDTKLGKEQITRDIPNLSKESMAKIDENGIVKIGEHVKSNDILVGKVTPKKEQDITPEIKLLHSIFGEKAKDSRDTSLRMPHGNEGVVIDVRHFTREKKHELPPGIHTMVKVYVAIKRRLSVGDKVAGRHGNKGVVSKICPIEDMPFLPDGTAVDIVLNPLGVPSRMNIGQVLEAHLGLAAHSLNFKVITPIFNGASPTDVREALVQRKEHQVDEHKEKLKDLLKTGNLVDEDRAQVKLKMEQVDELKSLLKALVDPKDREFDRRLTELRKRLTAERADLTAKLMGERPRDPESLQARLDQVNDIVQDLYDVDGKTVLYDGRTGESFDQPVVVGNMYLMKLNHIAAEKIHARSIGPYSLVTQQPLGGKANFGGQRLGEMEVWAIEAYGAAHVLQEMITIKSDDVLGRAKMYEAIIKGKDETEPGIPESFNVLVKELQGLALDVEVLDENAKPIDLEKLVEASFR